MDTNVITVPLVVSQSESIAMGRSIRQGGGSFEQTPDGRRTERRLALPIEDIFAMFLRLSDILNRLALMRLFRFLLFCSFHSRTFFLLPS